jgi:hypothetical protein
VDDPEKAPHVIVRQNAPNARAPGLTIGEAL